MAELHLTTAKMHRLVLYYLSTEGYISTALEFFKESGIGPATEFAPPGLINMPVLSANIEQALNIFSVSYPQILSQNSELRFVVLKQKLIEMIRNGRLEEASEFCMEHIAPYIQKGEFESEILKTVSLLDCEDPYDCADPRMREL